MQRILRFSKSAVSFSRKIHVSSAVFSHGKTDSQLQKALAEEFTFEKANNIADDSFIQKFKSNTDFKVVDVQGKREVSLVRIFGNEKITAIFSTDSLQQEVEEESEENEPEIQVPVTVIIEKSGVQDSGALEFETTIVQEGEFYIENVTFSSSSKLSQDESAEADWQRSAKFGGPNFGNLDEGLQSEFNSFLAERGFNEELAEFIREYVSFKEQNEYVDWLKNVGDWVKK